MLSLEGCISGNLPRDAKPAAPVCRELRAEQARAGRLRARHLHQRGRRTDPRPDQLRPRRRSTPRPTAPRARRAGLRRGAWAVATAEQEQFAQEARRIVTANYAQRALELAVRYRAQQRAGAQQPGLRAAAGVRAEPRRRDPEAALRLSVPAPDAAVIQARLRPGLSAEERRDAIAMVRQAVAAKPFDLKFGSYVVSGSPVVAEGVAAGLSDSAPGLVAAAILLVALALVLTFRAWPVLLPLALGAGATAITLGGLSLLGGSFSVGVAAAMPLLCGAGSRVGASAAGARSMRRRRSRPGRSPRRSRSRCSLISPVPMARSFGAAGRIRPDRVVRARAHRRVRPCSAREPR